MISFYNRFIQIYRFCVNNVEVFERDLKIDMSRLIFCKKKGETIGQNNSFNIFVFQTYTKLHAMDNIIKDKLVEIENELDIRILFACESGSRAWGFASPDSDYDVRFVYAHNIDFYLSIDDRRDVIELDITDLLDVNGWDLRKALRLYRASNASMFEWLQSPIVYRKDESFYNALMSMAPQYFSLRAGIHHYVSQTRSCYEKELQGHTVRLKKYFYALRPILAAMWIIEKKEMPPMEFGILRTLLRPDLQATVDALIALKAEEDEKYRVETILPLTDFIRENLLRCEEAAQDFENHRGDTEGLDSLFRQSILHGVKPKQVV